MGPTVCSQLVTDKSQGNVKHWAELQELGRASDNPRSEPEKDTQPRLALPGFPWACEHWAPGMAALLVTPPALGLTLGTWPFLREAGLGLGPRSPWEMARKALWLSGGGEIPLVCSTVQGLIRNSEHLGGPRIGKEGEASPKLMETWNVSPTNPKPLGGWMQQPWDSGCAPAPGTSDATGSCTTTFQTHCYFPECFIFSTYQIRKKSVQDTCQ